jgi:hypothetical protein
VTRNWRREVFGCIGIPTKIGKREGSVPKRPKHNEIFEVLPQPLRKSSPRRQTLPTRNATRRSRVRVDPVVKFVLILIPGPPIHWVPARGDRVVSSTHGSAETFGGGCEWDRFHIKPRSSFLAIIKEGGVRLGRLIPPPFLAIAA